jgi:hypothetical protein
MSKKDEKPIFARSLNCWHFILIGKKNVFFFLILFLSFKEQENKYNPHRDRQIKKKDSDDSGRCFIIILTEKKKSRLFYSNNV